MMICLKAYLGLQNYEADQLVLRHAPFQEEDVVTDLLCTTL